MIPFLAFLFCLFAVFSMYLIVTRKSAAREAQVKKRVADLLAYPTTSLENEAVTEPEPPETLQNEIARLDRYLSEVAVGKRIQRLIEQANLKLTVTKFLLQSLMIGSLAGLITSLFSPLWFASLLAAALAALIPLLRILQKRKQRLHKFLTDLPGTLELLSRALSAGHAFTEALNIVANEVTDPIGMEFRKTYEELTLGLSPKLALGNLIQRIPLLDLRICVIAILIQRETGGNLAEILDKVAATIRDRFRILEDLKTLTTSSRMSAWVLCGIPILIAVVTTAINPEYMSILWDDPRGHKLVAVAIGMQICGMLLVRKFLRIKI